MNLRKRLIAFIAIISLMLTFVPAGTFAQTVNSDAQKKQLQDNIRKKQLQQNADKKRLVKNDLVKQPVPKKTLKEALVNCEIVKNDDGHDTYSLEIWPESDAGTYVGFYNSTQYDEYKDRITRVTVREGVRGLDDYCFYNLKSLTSVSLPSTLKTIGQGAFQDCFCLNEIEIPSSVSTIGEKAFCRCGSNPTLFDFPEGYNTPAEKSRICYDVKYKDTVSPDAPEGTTYLSQFDESYSKMAEIIDGLGINEDDSDIVKVKKIYDWITQNVSYDYDALEPDNSDWYNYASTAHCALFKHRAICSGFADLTAMMLKEVGVRCIEYTSDAMFHEWLLIQVDGKWYEADSTWDAGHNDVEYRYFLKSHEYMISDSTDNFDYHNAHTWDEMNETFNATYPISHTDYGRFTSGDFTYQAYGDEAYVVKYYNKAYMGKDSAVTIPATVDYDGKTYDVTGIGSYVFDHKEGITTLTIPSGVRKISDIPLGRSFVSKVVYKGTVEQFDEAINKNGNHQLLNVTVQCSDGVYKNPFMLQFATIKISKTKLVYNGKKQWPVTVTSLDGKVLKRNVDYIAYVNDDEDLTPKNVDEYYLSFDGIGKYSGYKLTSKVIRIYPAPTKLKKLAAGKKYMKVYWTKKTAQVKGYQVQYALNSKFTKKKKTVTVKSYKTASIKIKKLKSKKIYYVRVRTYKYAPNYDDNFYSSWSNVKKIKVK